MPKKPTRALESDMRPQCRMPEVPRTVSVFAEGTLRVGGVIDGNIGECPGHDAATVNGYGASRPGYKPQESV